MINTKYAVIFEFDFYSFGLDARLDACDSGVHSGDGRQSELGRFKSYNSFHCFKISQISHIRKKYEYASKELSRT